MYRARGEVPGNKGAKIDPSCKISTPFKMKDIIYSLPGVRNSGISRAPYRRQVTNDKGGLRVSPIGGPKTKGFT